MKSKICGACGAVFECAAPQRGCWCESVTIDRATLVALRERFADCLCPKCLNEALVKAPS